MAHLLKKKNSGAWNSLSESGCERPQTKETQLCRVSELLAAPLHRQILSHTMQIGGFLDVLDIVRKRTANSNRSCKIIMGGFHCLARDVGKRRLEVGRSFPTGWRRGEKEGEGMTVSRTL